MAKIFPIIKHVTVIQEVIGGGGPNPADDYSLAVHLLIAETAPAAVDAVAFAFTFPDSVPAQTETVRLGLTYPDTVQAVADALLRLGLGLAETIAVQNDLATFLINLTLADTVNPQTETLGLGIAFPDTVGTPTETLKLGLPFADTVGLPTEALALNITFLDSVGTPGETLSLGIAFPDTVPAQTETLKLGLPFADTVALPAEAVNLGIAGLGDTVALPTETVKLGLTGLGDTVGAPTDSRASVAQFFLSASAGTSHVTSPANANGKNDGTSSTQQTAVAGATTETLTSSCGSGIPAATAFATAIYRGWFVATVVLATSTVKIVAHSTSALFTDVTVMTTTATLNSAGGTFTFDLAAAGINTLAKLQSVQILHSTTDAAAGVSPAVLTVDAGCIELTGVM